MTGGAVALALGAALLHALWNLLLGGSRDVLAATAVALGSSLVLAAPVAVATWDVQREAVPWLVASAALELVYFFALAAAYQRADVSLVYPIARGGAPVLVLAWSLAFGAELGASEVAGVLAVAAGVVLVRGFGHGDRVGVAFGVVIALLIAAYTLVDAEGIEFADPVPYLLLILIPTTVAATLATGPARLRAQLSTRTVLAGCAGLRRLRARPRGVPSRARRSRLRGARDERPLRGRAGRAGAPRTRPAVAPRGRRARRRRRGRDRPRLGRSMGRTAYPAAILRAPHFTGLAKWALGGAHLF